MFQISKVTVTCRTREGVRWAADRPATLFCHAIGTMRGEKVALISPDLNPEHPQAEWMPWPMGDNVLFWEAPISLELS